VVTNCTIVVERLGESRYRARCLFLPDCEAIAATADAAREAVAAAVDSILRERDYRTAKSSPKDGCETP
jgi:hypothetical protein